MKILLVSENVPAPKLGGLGKQMVALGNALLASGHEVALMGRDKPSYSACAVEIGFNGRFIAGFGDPFKGWKEHQLGFFNPWKRSYFAKKLADAIVSHGKEFDVIHYHGHQPMVGSYIPTSMNFVQTRHDQGGDCIVNTRFRDGDICVERDAASCAGCIHPKPGMVQTLLSELAIKRYRNETEEAYARHPVIFVSEFLRQNFSRTMPKARLGNSAVIHNFLDSAGEIERAEPSAVTNLGTGVRILVVGRLDEPKGIAQLLDILMPRMPDGWSVDVYGDGPLRKTVEIKHSGSALRMHGHCSTTEIFRATRSATVVVMPSVWEEAFGMVTLEALRLNRICYALNRGGTPELKRYGARDQLRLFSNLNALVDALISTIDFSSPEGGDEADVQARMHDVLDVYQRGVRNS